MIKKKQKSVLVFFLGFLVFGCDSEKQVIDKGIDNECISQVTVNKRNLIMNDLFDRSINVITMDFSLMRKIDNELSESYKNEAYRIKGYTMRFITFLDYGKKEIKNENINNFNTENFSKELNRFIEEHTEQNKELVEKVLDDFKDFQFTNNVNEMLFKIEEIKSRVYGISLSSLLDLKSKIMLNIDNVSNDQVNKK